MREGGRERERLDDRQRSGWARDERERGVGIGTRLFGSGRDPGGAGLSISGTVTSVKRGSFPWKAEVTMTERRRRLFPLPSVLRLPVSPFSLDERNERKADLGFLVKLFSILSDQT